MNTIYVGNLPSQIDESKLTTLFSLCGSISSVKVIRYEDHKEGSRAYGFVTFTNSYDASKALNFHEKLYSEDGWKNISDPNSSTKQYNVLHVRYAERPNTYPYAVFLGGIRNSVTKDAIVRHLKSQYGDYVSSDINYISGSNIGCVFINFLNDDNRQTFLITGAVTFGQQPQIKEPKKITVTLQPKEGKFVVKVQNLQKNVSKKALEAMFTLCGPFETIIFNQEKQFAIITFISKNGFETALKFDGTIPNKWSTPLDIKENGTVIPEYETTFDAIIKNFGENFSLTDIEKRLCNTPNGVKIVKPIRKVPGEEPYLLAYFKKKRDLDEALEVSGVINLNGSGPAIIQVCPEVLRVGRGQEKQTIRKRSRSKPRPSPLQGGRKWKLNIENADVDFTTINDLMGRIGTVSAIMPAGGVNKWTVELTPNI